MTAERNKILGKNIRIERLKKELSQEGLAELVDMHYTSISLIERGVQTPSVFTVVDIARALDVKLMTLFKGIAK